MLLKWESSPLKAPRLL